MDMQHQKNNEQRMECKADGNADGIDPFHSQNCNVMVPMALMPSPR